MAVPLIRRYFSSRIRRSARLHVLALKLLDWLGRSPHEAEFDLLPLLCEPGQLALDIGANVGTVSRLLLKAGAQVVAIEPIPKLGRLLRFRIKCQLRSSGDRHSGWSTVRSAGARLKRRERTKDLDVF